MAEGAVSFTLKTITTIIRNEYNLLTGVRDEIEFMRREFEQMNVVLQVAGDKEDTDPLFDEWVKQVRDTAYDAGDVLELIVYHLENRHRSGGGFSGFISRSSSFMKTIFVRHEIASEIQRIKLKVDEVSQRQHRYAHFKDVQASSSSNTVATSTKYDIRHDALLLTENEIVGITGPKTELINWLMDKEFNEKRVLSVCGMGGLGKTTIVKKIYDDKQLVSHFEAHVWITVSKSFQPKELLKETIKKLYSELRKKVPVEVEEMEPTDLVNFIKDFLQTKRYVIVLDDIWKNDAWEALKRAFPSNNCGSRVIITTRDTSVASFACNESNSLVHNLQPLPIDESRTLFCKKVFRGNLCPSSLEEITEAILKKCDGLPLAIVVIGGLLSTKGQRIDEWTKIYRGLRAELRNEGRLVNLEKVLTLSYFDLPWYLKLCFLYLSIFPEDYSIDHWRLIRLWVAEGFVLSTPGQTPEEVAGSYLTELTDRSLILIKRVGENGRAKEYHIHDIWRELIISRSRKHDLVTIYGAQQNEFPYRVRRLSIHNKIENWQEFKDRATHVRSLLMFGSIDIESTSSIVDSLGAGARLLKVLDMRNQGLKTFPRQIGRLLHLKYLSLRRNRDIEEIPKSIGNLQMLETLDLKFTGVKELPDEILKLHRLRHLLVGSHYYSGGFKALKGMDKLLSLEKLCAIELNEERNNNDDVLRSISKLTRLRKINIRGLRSGDGKELCSTLDKLTELRSLYITTKRVKIPETKSIDLEPCSLRISTTDIPNTIRFESIVLSSPPKYIQTLGVFAKMEKLPQWIASLRYLTKLILFGSELKENPLEQLGDLPNLTHLRLNNAYSSGGEELCLKAGGTFKQLTSLNLGPVNRLKRVRVMEGAMPRLEKLTIRGCPSMDSIPSGIETLSSLSLLDFHQMSGEFHSKLKRDMENGNPHPFQIRLFFSTKENGNYTHSALIHHGGSSTGVSVVY